MILLNKWLSTLICLMSLTQAACELFPKPSQKRVRELTSSELAKRNSEILQEMIRVVQLGEPESPEFFGGLVNSMNQGASFEGIYNGIIHNSVYRGVEETAEPAHFKVVEAFIDQMFIFQAQALAKTPRSDMVSSFKKSSTFTLKRILGDEAIQFLRRFQDHKDLAIWYGDWAAGMTKYKVDFGLPLRNNPDPSFHRKFAMGATQDTIDWEVLNRLHRVLNAFHQKQ